MKRNLLKVAAFLFAAVISVSAMAQTVALQEPIQEPADTYERNGNYQLVNQWIRAQKADNYSITDLGGSGLVRGMVAKDGKMYFCFRNNSGGAHSIIVVDGITGAYEKTITLSANAWITESVDAETGEVTMVNAVTFPNKDIKLDSEGNFLVGPCITSGAQPMMVYKVDIETGECTELINEVIANNPEYAELMVRFDAFGVWGDVEDYAVVMAVNANAMNAFRWVIEDGVAGAAELVTLDPLFEGDATVNPGTAPQIMPISEDLFYVDGNATFPTLYQYADGKGTRIDCFYDAEGNALPILSTMNQGHNGIADFELTNAEGETEYFMCCAATNTAKDPRSSFAIIKYADESLSFQTAELIYQFPSNGFGGTSNPYRTAPVSVEVIDNVAHLYCYVGENGFGHYTFSCDNEDVDVDVYFNINLSCNSDQGTVVGSGKYSHGENVTIEAVAKEGYHFVRWSDGNTNATRTIAVTEDITLTAEFEIDDNRILISLEEPVQEPADTYEKKGDYQLVNQWIRSTTAGNYTKTDLGGSALVRGMVAKDSKMYFCYRGGVGTNSIIVVDGVTGAYEKTITLSANAFTKVENEGTDSATTVSAVTLPNNDIKLDSEGNFLVGPCYEGGAQHFQVYKVDIETGECVALIDEAILENPEYAELSIRFDAFGVWGDVEDFAVVMAMNAKAMNCFRWVIEDGVAGAAELVTLDPLFEGDASVNSGSAPQIMPISEDLFYVDGNATFPTLYQYADGKGTRIDCFYDAEGNSLPILGTMNQGHNGITDFQLVNAAGETEFFMCCAATNTAKAPESSFAIIKYADESLSFQTAELIYQFPSKGFGGTSNPYRTAPVSVEVIDNVAHLYCYVGENGFGHYTFSCDNEDVDNDTTPEPIKYIEYVNICHGDIYYFGGQYISETGIYQHIFAASNGCDSIVELHLTVLPDYKQTFDVTIREGETYNGHGFVGLTKQGTYSLPLVSVDGCDSTIILNLTVERIIVVDSIYYRKVSESEVSVIAPENDLYRGNIVIPESITYMGTAYSVIGIDQYAFANMPITSLTIEPNICPEYGNIIEGCEQLEVLKVGTCLLYNLDTYNEYYAFPSLRELHIIGGYVEYLPDYWDLEVVDLSKADNIDLYANLFVNTNYMYAWDNLKRLVLPENLEVIYPRQFEGLWLLEEIVIPENVTEIPDGAFYNCHALSSVTLSKNLLSIGNYAFYNCHAIKNLVVPEGVTEIGNSAFYGCTYLEEIELPTTLTEINDNAFALCSKVKSIKSKALVPPMLSVKTFYEIDRNIPVYVAEKAYDKYVNDQYWSEFFNIIAVPEYSGGETTLIEDTNTESFVVYTQGGMLHIEGVDTDYNIFDSTGKLIYTGNSSQLQLSQGVYIIVAGNKVQKVVL